VYKDALGCFKDGEKRDSSKRKKNLSFTIHIIKLYFSEIRNFTCHVDTTKVGFDVDKRVRHSYV